MPDITLRAHQDHWVGGFQAMASPCDIIVDDGDKKLAQHLTQLAQQEALRIHNKFSRYQTHNVVWKINHAEGKPVSVDEETAHLLNFAEHCFELSEGFFDITSGCLRRVWQFDGSDRLPTADAVAALMPLIGWQKIQWKNPTLQLPLGMELDFGGIGKEYAVDCVLKLLQKQSSVPILVNFGGDLAVSGARKNGTPWQVGIEIPHSNKDANDKNADHKNADKVLDISAGALATSGDSRRFLLVGNKRYSHILNPFSGYPVEDAPRSITVAGSTCILAGMLATFGLLKGAEAELFLEAQGVPFWILR
jgi:FAD:protein FMN transferase